VVDTLLVNLYGGPGTGKSTTMHGLIYELRKRGILAEMAPEFAKEAVWEGRTHLLENQLYLFAKQAKVLYDLAGKVDVIVTDAPILNSLLYNEAATPAFEALVLEVMNEYANQLNVILRRVKPYETRGRVNTEAHARLLDARIASLVWQHCDADSVIVLDADETTVGKVIFEVDNLT